MLLNICMHICLSFCAILYPTTVMMLLLLFLQGEKIPGFYKFEAVVTTYEMILSKYSPWKYSSTEF